MTALALRDHVSYDALGDMKKTDSIASAFL
jgi:hypothetical protein